MTNIDATFSETAIGMTRTGDAEDTQPVEAALLPPIDERNQAWHAESMVLCNWGGFDGVHEFPLDPESTLFSGATGAGKSTILDTYTCLMHPNKPLNSASNEAGAKTRGEGIRTPLTYVRGVYDHAERADGTMGPLTLRSGDKDTWSAIALVFASTTGARLTLLRLFYAPREATRVGDMQARFAVYPGRLRARHIIDQVEPLAAKSFRKDLTEKAIPGLRMLTPGDYSDYAQRNLNIGPHQEGGAKALRLLYDLQAGAPVTSVDALFKHLVLERPSTFAVADAVVASFDHLAEMHQEMREKEEQATILAEIEGHHAALRAAEAEIERIDTLRLRDPDRSPFVLWAEARKDALFDAEIRRLKEAQRVAEEERSRWDQRTRDIDAEAKDTRRQWADLGGEKIDTVDATLDRLNHSIGQVRSTRTAYEHATREVGTPVPRTIEEYNTAQAHAGEFLAAYADEERRLNETTRKKTFEHGQLKERRDTALKEEKELGDRAGNIEGRRHLLRVEFAKRAGLSTEELPFAGELIDMNDEFEDWRAAADAVLGGFANTMLVDERHRHGLKRAIDEVKAPIRIEYRGVEAGLTPGPAADACTLAGRLTVKPGSTFEGWLRQYLNRDFAYECVETADLLGDDSIPRVTRTGQTQRGARGAHGGHGRRNIGFSNEARRAELRDEIDRLNPKIDALETELDALDAEKRRLVRKHSGSEHIRRTKWVDIDIAGIQAEIVTHNEAKARLLASQDQLQALSDRLDELDTGRNEAQENAWEQKRAIEECVKQRGDLDGAADTLRSHLWMMQDDDTIVLTADQQAFLDDALAKSTWDRSLEAFDNYTSVRPDRLGHLARDLAHSQATAETKVEAATLGLTSAFSAFQRQWYEPNRGTGLASYEEYLAILTDLRVQGLSGQRQDWARQVTEWGGEDLMTLHNAYDKTHHEIAERLHPIKRILAQIPFGRGTTLDINSAARTPPTVVSFKNNLRTLASGSMDPRMDTDEVEAKFEAIRTAIARVRQDSDERNLLLDIRRHLNVTASEVDSHGIRGPVYDNLLGKSGGETQTLTAFIVGAALRYHLGDEDRDRPRFTPVVLDEAFIKADVRHAARAVDAWRRLGFQLIIGAPEGQFGALERAMGLVIGVTKDADEYSYAIPLPRKTENETT